MNNPTYSEDMLKQLQASPESIAPHLAKVLKSLGVDLTDPEFKDTPMRWARMLWEFRPKTGDIPNIKVFLNKGYEGLVHDACEFASICGHHMGHISGVVHMAYIPDKYLLGLSKLSRIADFYARQPTTQEYLTQNIADYIQTATGAKGVAVRVEAKHTCKSARGIAKQFGKMKTTVLKGAFLEDGRTREEFLSYVESGYGS